MLRTLLMPVAIICLVSPAQSQETPRDFSSLRLTEEPRFRKVVNIGRDYLNEQNWEKAVEALQLALDELKDYYFQAEYRDPADPKKEITRWVSLRHEADRLIGSMPAKGLQAYQAKFGFVAQQLLNDALKTKDREKLHAVVRTYRHTKAGSEALKLLTKDGAFEPTKVDGWPTWGGQATKAGPPLLDKKLWSRPVCNDKIEFDDMDSVENTLSRLKASIKQVRDLKRSILPGSFPVVSQEIMVYSTPRDIRAIALKAREVMDDETRQVAKIKPGQILWKSIPHSRSLGTLLDKYTSRDYRITANKWFEEYDKVPGFSSFVYENTVIGTLSADQRYVYAINDLGIPPHPNLFAKGQFNPANVLKAGDIQSLLLQNELYAYDLVTGKMKWDLDHVDTPFGTSHFLSAPLSIGNRLYVLNERFVPPLLGGALSPGESELRLFCIDPNKTIFDGKGFVKPTIVHILPLGKIAQESRMVQDIRRRIHACPLAFADGILVCPTNAGEVFGIDLVTRSMAWSYPYREGVQEPIVLPGMQPPKGMAGTTVLAKWKAAPPVIHRGKLVFTAPDADSIHCVDLKDGKPIWKKARKQGDLYHAGIVAGRVLIVGDKTIRAIDVQDGSQFWSIDLGDLPAGRGAASDGIYYYLPLTKEILAVDVVKGIVKARHRLPAGASSPGNLVFYEDQVLFQTPTDVIAYPQLTTK